MKDRSAIFLLVITLIIVWFASKGLVKYWGKYIADYQHISLSDVCYKYDGNSSFTGYLAKDYQGNDKEMVRFTCEFNK
jgi:hypothetical protein